MNDLLLIFLLLLIQESKSNKFLNPRYLIHESLFISRVS